jgi:hypothetical protein
MLRYLKRRQAWDNAVDMVARLRAGRPWPGRLIPQGGKTFFHFQIIPGWLRAQPV